jgi:hypothetical protein
MAYQLATASYGQKMQKVVLHWSARTQFFLIFNVSCICHCFGGGLSPKLAAHHKHKCTIDLHLSRLIGMTGQPNVQKIWIIGFKFENMLYWQFEVEKFLQTVVSGYVFI